MLTNSETGRLQCERCGTDLVEEPGEVDRVGDVYCVRCSGKMDGEAESSRASASEFLEVAFMVAAYNGLERADLHELVDDVFDGRGLYGGRLG